MRERTQALKGHFDMQQSPRGVRIQAVFPLNQEAQTA
jgi:signal transduction histidine kinase